MSDVKLVGARWEGDEWIPGEFAPVESTREEVAKLVDYVKREMHRYDNGGIANTAMSHEDAAKFVPPGPVHPPRSHERASADAWDAGYMAARRDYMFAADGAPGSRYTTNPHKENKP